MHKTVGTEIYREEGRKEKEGTDRYTYRLEGERVTDKHTGRKTASERENSKRNTDRGISYEVGDTGKKT